MTETQQYDFELPHELIAQHPLPCRTDARLMVVDRRAGTIEHAHVRDLPDLLAVGDCLVLNDTKVVRARLVGYRTRTGGRWTGLFLRSDERGVGDVLCRTRGRLSPGETVTLQDRDARDAIRLRALRKQDGGIWEMLPEAEEDWPELLERFGRVPLPHYIRDGKMVDADLVDYQTVFASQLGAVAAPTAGLHFTQTLLDRIEARGIQLARVTLHVGLGTFRPISASRLEDHQMHTEWGQLDASTVDRLRACRSKGGRVVAVGTTVVRLLESAAAAGSLQAWQGSTNLFIRPPYRFQAVDVLMTNFHLPKSTLLVLVRTFGGDSLIRRAYQEAIEEQYRFFSYGDAMLIC